VNASARKFQYDINGAGHNVSEFECHSEIHVQLVPYIKEIKMSSTDSILLRGNGDFTPEQYAEVLKGDNDKHLMLALGLTTAPGCNIKCVFCYSDGGMKEAGRDITGLMTLADFEKAIKESAEIGAQSAILVGIGETLMDKKINRIIETIHHYGMYPLVFTNGTLLTSRMVKFLHDHETTMYLSLNSVREETYNQITQTKGFFPKVMKGIDYCLDAGFGEISTRNGHQVTDFAVNTMLMKLNIDELDELDQFCRSKNILFTCRLPEKLGMAQGFWQTFIAGTPEEEKKIKDAVAKHSLGGEVFRTEHGCLFWVAGVLLGVDGKARLCYSLNNKHDFGNIKTDSMKDIILKKNSVYPVDNLYFCPIHAEMAQSRTKS